MMARYKLWATLLLAFAASASAQFGGPKRPKPKAPVNKEDLKFIRCQVCEAMAKETRNIMKDLSEAAGAKKISEADILERLEKFCDPDKNDGDWITKLDIVEEGTSLVLKDTGLLGKCKSECRTIAKACEQISEDIDLTDLSGMLYKGKQRAAVTNWICYDATNACLKKPPPVPSDRPAGESHEPLEQDEISAIKMQRNMEGSGMSGSLYSRESMMEELEEMKDLYGDDPDFAQVFKDTGMDSFVPGKSAADEPLSADDTRSASSSSLEVGDAVAKLQETAAKAAETIKEGATKVVEGAKNLMGKLLGGNKKAEL